MSDESFEVYFIGSSPNEVYFSVFCTCLLILVRFVLFLNATVTFPMVMIKQKNQIILCPSIDERLFCRL